MFTKVLKCKSDIIPLNMFWSILSKKCVRESNIELLLETATHIATTETFTCIITIDRSEISVMIT